MKKQIRILLLASSLLLAGCGSNTASNSTKGDTSDSSEALTFTVTFYDGDGSILDTVTVKAGGSVTYTGEEPYKQGDSYFKYEFTGWDKSLDNISANTDVHPLFKEVRVGYDVVFEDYDGTLLEKRAFSIGDIPFYSKSNPFRDGNETKNYAFTGWDPSLTAVTDSDEIYTAQYAESAYTPTYALDTDHYVYSNVTGAKNYVEIPAAHAGEDGVSHPVTTIGKGAFQHVIPTKIVLGKNVNAFAADAFFCCNNSYYVLKDNTAFSTALDDRLLYKGKQLVSIGGYNTVSFSTVALPADTTDILPFASSFHKQIQHLDCGSSLLTIGENAFAGSNVMTIKVGDKLTTIGKGAFGSSPLNSIDLPKSLTSIGLGAFSTCKDLATVNYAGTKEEWAAIAITAPAFEGVKATVVTCSDGTVALS